MGHPSLDCSRANLLNFGLLMEPEASELLKGLVLGRDGNIHLRITPLGDVGCYNPPPLGARCPRQHTFGQGLVLIPHCHIPARTGPLPRLDSAIARYCPLWAYHSLTILFLRTHEQLPSGLPIMGLFSHELA
ncbi:hypothetical protein ACFXTO_043108 [Malus domestica]